MIYAVDFDGTLVEDAYPEIGKKKDDIFKFVLIKRAQGNDIILNTMREGEKLEEAVKFCKDNGLEFDAINDNLDYMKKKFNNNPRKIFADYYIDDRNLSFKEVRDKLYITKCYYE